MIDETGKTTTEDELLGQAADEFFAAVSRGESPSISDFARRYSSIADLIERTFPALAVLDGSRSDSSSTDALASHKAPKALGDFQIVRELGRGGMGVVYEAEQLSMGRKVALKILPLAAMLDQQRLDRFHNEVRAAAALDHPHCVPIYAVGEERGVHYYAMKLIRGQSLARVIGDLRHRETLASGCAEQIKSPLSLNGNSIAKPIGRSAEAPAAANLDDAKESGAHTLSASRSARKRDYFRRVAELGIQAAEALHHAHEHGVVHRDVKPGNLLLDAEGNLWVTDFGLARIEADAGMTMTGDLLGTLRYMSPEQALGKRALVDHRVDIYSLGATLYELLTLQPAIRGEERGQMLKQFTDLQPTAPRKIDPSIPQELETIVAKTMEADPAERYATAAELADDLGRFLANEPIHARRSTAAERSVKWMRRYPVWTALIALAVASTALITGLSLRHARELTHINADLTASLSKSEQLRETADAATTEAQQQKALLERHLYVADMNLAYQALEASDLRRYDNLMRKHLPANDQQRPGIEWRFLWRLGHPRVTLFENTPAPLYCICPSPTGEVYATVGAEGIVRLYDYENEKLIDQFSTNQGEVNSVRFSPDGKNLATAGDDGTVKVWSWPEKKELHVIKADEDLAFGALFLPDGKSLVTWGSAPAITLWDLATGKRTATLEGHTKSVQQAQVSPNGKLLASCSHDRTVAIWDLNNLERVVSLNAKTPVDCLAFSVQGDSIFAGTSQGHMEGWNLTDQQLVFAAKARDDIHSVAISPSGNEVAFGDGNGVVRVYDVNKGDPIAESRLHISRIYSLCFSPEGKRLLSCGQGGKLKSWDYRQPCDSQILRHSRIRLVKAVGEKSIAGFGKSGIYIVDPASGEVVSTLTTDGEWHPPSFGAESDQLVVARESNEIRLWEAKTGKLLHRWQLPISVRSIAISHDERMVAAVDWEDNIIIFDSVDGDEVLSLKASAGGGRLAFSNDDRFLAFTNGLRINLMNIETEEKTLSLELGIGDSINGIVFSPDDTTLATIGGDRIIRLWDIESGDQWAAMEGHQSRIEDIRYLSDGRTLLTSDITGFAFWDILTQQQFFFYHVSDSHHDTLDVKGEYLARLASVTVSPQENWIAFSTKDRWRITRILSLEVDDVWPRP